MCVGVGFVGVVEFGFVGGLVVEEYCYVVVFFVV